MPGQKKTTIEHVNETGLALCNYFEAGWGEQVKHGRTIANHYSNDLVEASATLLLDYLETLDAPPGWITYVPSMRRPTLVQSFAHRLSSALGLACYSAVVHVTQHAEQSTMHNSYQQATNVARAFQVQDTVISEPVLLVDDLTDSGWTLAVIGHLLRERHTSAVHPFVLATMKTG
jgi:ATP-dependent DNA helicase RecQ